MAYQLTNPELQPGDLDGNEDVDIRQDIAECIRDAEEALNTAAILAAKLNDEMLRRAFVTARTYLRNALDEGGS